jgi:hypothetical protein
VRPAAGRQRKSACRCGFAKARRCRPMRWSSGPLLSRAPSAEASGSCHSMLCGRARGLGGVEAGRGPQLGCIGLRRTESGFEVGGAVLGDLEEMLIEAFEDGSGLGGRQVVQGITNGLGVSGDGSGGQRVHVHSPVLEANASPSRIRPMRDEKANQSLRWASSPLWPTGVNP